jgi:hypothetical protein
VSFFLLLELTKEAKAEGFFFEASHSYLFFFTCQFTTPPYFILPSLTRFTRSFFVVATTPPPMLKAGSRAMQLR